MEKMTIMEQIDAIAFDTLTAEQFDFLVERARKSVRKAGAKTETKAQKANKELAVQVAQFVAEKGEAVTASEIEKTFGMTSNQKAVAVLKVAVGMGLLEKTDANGKNKATWSAVVAE